jgi:hypothetical protein
LREQDERTNGLLDRESAQRGEATQQDSSANACLLAPRHCGGR